MKKLTALVVVAAFAVSLALTAVSCKKTETAPVAVEATSDVVADATTDATADAAK